MLKINKKKIKPYGDRLDDGSIQLSFTFPVPVSPEAREAAKQYVEKLGLKNVSVATMEPMGEDFSFFVVYASAVHNIDVTRIRVPKIDAEFMDYKGLTEYMSRHFDSPIVVVGGAIGTDAHTVGIDAIMNMKGFAGDYGLERYPLIKAHNLRSQISNETMIEKAVELKADAILISQVVTQRDSHITNLKSFIEVVRKDKRVGKEVLLIVGGPRLDHSMALKLGYDAGFGPGTKPSQVASFIVKELMKRRKISEKAAVVPVPDVMPKEDIKEDVKESSVPGAPKVEEQAASPEVKKPSRRRRRPRGGRRFHSKNKAKTDSGDKTGGE